MHWKILLESCFVGHLREVFSLHIIGIELLIYG
jgi:hypothetical protein